MKVSKGFIEYCGRRKPHHTVALYDGKWSSCIDGISQGEDFSRLSSAVKLMSLNFRGLSRTHQGEA